MPVGTRLSVLTHRFFGVPKKEGSKLALKEVCLFIVPAVKKNEFFYRSGQLHLSRSQTSEGVECSDFTRRAGQPRVLVVGISSVLQIVDNRLPDRLIILQKS